MMRQDASCLALNLRRLHHGIPHAGIVFPVDNIDISSAAQRSSTLPEAAVHHAPAPARPQFRPSSESTPPIHPVLSKVKKRPATQHTLSSQGRLALLAVAVCLALIEILTRQLNAEKDRLAEATRLIAEAPDLAVLQESSDSDALAVHLSGLMRTFLTARGNEELERALARLRTQGDFGRPAIAEACMQFREIIQNQELSRVERKRRLTATLVKLLRYASEGEQPEGSAMMGSEANRFFGMDYSPVRASINAKAISDLTEPPSAYMSPLRG
ncbi:hypothetical protein DFH08DRAFT_894292 [Mycena albidolilacea]|uniref:Uncharacterized protein n=1 Tax=Mycena albidolilacea TaxID=1033008 RepID=A0AAD6ZB83_9AGAR|nr:hypothetical protein DFH08DRAFT_894292 [Mycena albidolilacea]